MIRNLILLAGCFCSFSLMAQSDDSITIKKISDDIFLNGKAYENLRVLTKTIGGRMAGSPQM